MRSAHAPRHPTKAARGMVATPHHLASAAGLGMLQRGGSAVDAAIAANAVLGVVYPHMAGPGGGLFFLLWDALGGRVEALDGRGRAGGAGAHDFFPPPGPDRIPLPGPLVALTLT